MPVPPVGSTDNDELTKLELKVEPNGLAWKESAAALAVKLLKLDEVAKATVEKEGRITLELEKGKELEEATVKKLVKEAGFKFKSLRNPDEAEEKDPVAVD